jgi:hypothetical protein
VSDLSELIADARAIPAAAFTRARCATTERATERATEAAAAVVIDLTVPTQRSVMRIPKATISLVEAAGEHFATLSR